MDVIIWHFLRIIFMGGMISTQKVTLSLNTNIRYHDMFFSFFFVFKSYLFIFFIIFMET